MNLFLASFLSLAGPDLILVGLILFALISLPVVIAQRIVFIIRRSRRTKMTQPPPLPSNFCPRCGAGIQADANFCQACGAPIKT